MDAYFPLLKTLPSAKDDNANQDDDDDDDNDDAAFEDSSQHASWLNKNNNGDRIQFLPGDIKGLETKLNYLLAKYRAGNRSSLTRNQITPILDEGKEYREKNTGRLTHFCNDACETIKKIVIVDWEDMPDRECSMLSVASYSLVDSKKL